MARFGYSLGGKGGTHDDTEHRSDGKTSPNVQKGSQENGPNTDGRRSFHAGWPW